MAVVGAVGTFKLWHLFELGLEIMQRISVEIPAMTLNSICRG
jgi:hypothetical protein